MQRGSIITFPAYALIWLIAGVTDMRCSFNRLTVKVQNTMRADPFRGHLFILRGRGGNMVKILWADADGLCLCLFTKRLERGHFVWPVNRDGRVHLTLVQLAMLPEGINWMHPQQINPLACASEPEWNAHSLHFLASAAGPSAASTFVVLQAAPTFQPRAGLQTRRCRRRDGSGTP